MPDDRRRARVFVRGFMGGQYSNAPASLILPDEAQSSQDFDTSEPYRLKRRKSHKEQTTGPLVTATTGVINGLIMRPEDDGLAAVDFKSAVKTSIYRIDSTAGAWPAATVSGLDSGLYTMFDLFNGLTIIGFTNAGGGGTAPRKYTHATNLIAALGGTPPNGWTPVVHKGRVFFLGDAVNNYRVTFSALNDAEDYTTVDNSGSLTVSEGDGQVLHGGASDGDFLYIGKSEFVTGATKSMAGSLWLMSGSGPQDFAARKIAHTGPLNPYCIIPTQNFIVFLSSTGLWGVRGTSLFLLSEAVNDKLLRLGPRFWRYCSIGAREDKIYVSVPSVASHNHGVFQEVYEYNYKFHRWSPVVNEALFAFPFARDPFDQVFVGRTVTVDVNDPADADTELDILRLEAIDGTIVSGQVKGFPKVKWRTPELDFGDPTTDKWFRQLTLYTPTSAKVDYIVTQYVDGVAQSSDTISPDSLGINRLTGKADHSGKHLSVEIEFDETEWTANGDTTADAQVLGLDIEVTIAPRY